MGKGTGPGNQGREDLSSVLAAGFSLGYSRRHHAGPQGGHVSGLWPEPGPSYSPAIPSAELRQANASEERRTQRHSQAVAAPYWSG